MNLAPAPLSLHALALAESKIGAEYVWGAAGPDTFDCSGLMWWAYASAGYRWSRTNDAGQIIQGTKVATRAELLPGDLVRPEVGHIYMYAGAGYIVEAPHTGAQVRRVPMWGFLDATRLVPAVSAGPVVGRTAPHLSRVLELEAPHMTGTDVGAVQQLTGATVDDDFGPLTRLAVIAFQRRYWPHDATEWDGKVGPRTGTALGLTWGA